MMTTTDLTTMTTEELQALAAAIAAELKRRAAEAPKKRAYLLGDTYCIKGSIKAGGWRWDPGRKAWYMDGEWDDEAHVMRRVRGLAGVRNRGSFEVELQPLTDA
jgi:hypothetical protein